MWKKLLKRIGVSLAIFICALLLLLSFGGNIGRKYVEKQCKYLIGRKVEIGSISLNPLVGRMVIKELHIKEHDSQEDFLAIGNLSYRIKIIPLFSKKLSLTHLHIDSLYCQTIQNGKLFNFSDIIDQLKVPKYKSESSDPWKLELHNIKITRSRLLYKDLIIGSTLTFNGINIDIPQIRLAEEKDAEADAGITLKFSRKGSLSCRLSYNQDHSRFRLFLNLQDCSTESITPYLKQFLNIKECHGRLFAHMELSGSSEHISNTDVTGSILSVSPSVTDLSNKTIFAADSVKVSLRQFNIAKRIVDIDTLRIIAPETYYELMPDSTSNFSSLVREADNHIEETNHFAQNLSLKIDTVSIIRGSVKFTDNTLKEKFVCPISELSLHCKDFTLENMNHIKGEGVISKAGKMEIDWITDFRSMRNMTLNIRLSNISIKQFSPYAKMYVGNNIEGGTMLLESNNTVTDNYLTGYNQIEIYKPKVSKRIRRSKPLYDVPVRLGIYALTNRKGIMNIKLPVNGNLNNPQFSYRKILLKSLFNTFAKVATTPIAAIGNLFSASDNLEIIEFDVADDDFSTKEYGKLAMLAEGMLEKDEFTFEFEQFIDINKALKKHPELDKEKILFLANCRNENLSKFFKRMDIPPRRFNIKPFVADSTSRKKQNNGIYINAIWKGED